MSWFISSRFYLFSKAWSYSWFSRPRSWLGLRSRPFQWRYSMLSVKPSSKISSWSINLNLTSHLLTLIADLVPLKLLLIFGWKLHSTSSSVLKNTFLSFRILKRSIVFSFLSLFFLLFLILLLLKIVMFLFWVLNLDLDLLVLNWYKITKYLEWSRRA